MDEKKIEEMKALLAELESDERLTRYSAADVRINAPLALHQISSHAKATLLRWCLDLPPRKYYGKDDE